MKTIQDYKNLLNVDGKNTILGMHLNSIINNRYAELNANACVHDLDLKIEIIVHMYNNGVNCFNSEYKLGSVTKAYYEFMLNQYNEY